MNYSSNVFYNLWNGSHAEIPPTSFPSYIDVRDLAAAHVRALTEPQAANKRFLIGGEKLTYTDIVRTLAELAESEIPELQGRLPAESGENEKVVFAKVEADEGNRVLGLEGTLRTKTETFGDAARKILVLEMLQGGK
jgi:nucleoside-diphosphate-sugar epimerase